MASPESTALLKATCHCGAVTIQADLPRDINECQCTVCRRWAVAWAYYDPKDVKITGSTKTYVWGDCELEFHFCPVCACVTHWKSIEERNEMGVNTRMMDPDELKTVERKMDYEQLSVPLTATGAAHADDKAKY